MMRAPDIGLGNVADTTAATGITVEDFLKLRLQIDTTDAQGGLEEMQGIMTRMGAGAESSLGGVKSMLGNISKAAGLVGISMSGWAIARELLDTQQVLLDVEKGFYNVAREATRGGGAIQEWAQTHGNAAKDQYMEIAGWARESLRRTDKEITSIFDAMAKSGILATREMTGSAEESIGKMRKFAETAFVMEGMMGFNPQQIQSVFHSMATNLQMDSDAIYESIAKFGQLSPMINLPLNEQATIITTVLQQYSKFGVKLDDVAIQMKTLTEETKKGTDEFKNLGMTYDIIQARMQARTETTPQQWATLWQMLSPDQIYKAFTAGLEGADQIAKRVVDITTQLQKNGNELGTRLGFSEKDINSGVAAEQLMRKQGGVSAFEAGGFLQSMAAKDLFSGPVAGAEAGIKVTGGDILKESWLQQVLPGIIGAVLAEETLRYKRGEIDIYGKALESNLKAAQGAGATDQITKILEDQAKMTGQGVLTAAEYYSGSIKHLSDIAAATMGILKGIEFWKGSTYRTIMDRDYAEGAGRVYKESVESELPKRLEKIPSRTEEASWWEKLIRFLGESQVPPEALIDPKIAADLMLSRLGFNTKRTRDIAKDMSSGLSETFGPTIDTDVHDISAARKGIQVGNVTVPTSTFLDIMKYKESDPEFQKGLNLSKELLEGMNKLREWEKQGFKVPIPTKEIESPGTKSQETKPGAPTSALPKEQTGTAVVINTLNLRADGQNVLLTVEKMEDVLTYNGYERSQYYRA